MRNAISDVLFMFNELIHGRWSPTPDTLEPMHKGSDDTNQAVTKTCAKADLSASAIVDFLKTQKHGTGVFDQYVKRGGEHDDGEKK